jgi:hypothetical protein
MSLNPSRTRRIVFYVGSIEGFRVWVANELDRLRNPRTGDLVVPLGRVVAGRDYSIERGRRFIWLGSGRGDCVRGMRGLSASAVDVVFGPEHRASDDTVEVIRYHARYVTAGASADEVERERLVDEAMREIDEPYEIVVEALEALDVCADEEREESP